MLYPKRYSRKRHKPEAIAEAAAILVRRLARMDLEGGNLRVISELYEDLQLLNRSLIPAAMDGLRKEAARQHRRK